MTAIRNILCPVDFSMFSAPSLEHAIVLAKWFGSEITGMFVVPVGVPVVVDGIGPAVPPPPAEDRDQLTQALDKLLEPAARVGVRVHAEVMDGEPVKRILQRAEAIPADMIVMGTHGHGGFERLVLGSVTEKVLRKATCPVLTVPNPGSGTLSPRELLFGTIVCPVDFSEASLSALTFAIALAKESHGHLLVVHVLEQIPDDPRALMHFNMPNYRSFLELDVAERLKKAIPEADRERAGIEDVILTGKAHGEIQRLAKERGAGLIVMGVTGRSALDMALFGSTTNQLVRTATCPVLTIRSSLG